MFTRLTASLLLLTLIVPTALASSTEDFDKDTLDNYFIFDEGTWWDYLYSMEYASTEDLPESTNIVDNEEDATYRTTAETCQYTNCTTFNSEYSDMSYSYSVSDGKVYTRLVNGTDVGNILSWDIEGFSVDASDILAIFVGLAVNDHITSTNSCEFSDNDEFEVGGYTAEVIQNTCVLIADYDDEVYGSTPTFQMVSSEFYLENVGLIYAKVEYYYDKEWQYTAYQTLTDTSIDLIDLSEDTSTDVGESDQEVTTTTDATTSVENPFSDLRDTHRNYDAILYLFEQGMINGYDDGSFKPNSALNRAELIKILVEGKGVNPDSATYQNCFIDVATDWYAPYVCYAKEQGWVSGYGDGSFKPADIVNKVEALKMLLNSQSIETVTPTEAPFTDVSVSDWFAPYVAKAKELGLLEEDSGGNFSPDSDRNRGSICENLYRALLSLQVVNTSDVMAKSTCLLFDETKSSEEIEQEVQDIMENHGFENDSAIDDYIALIQDLLVYDQLSSQLSSDLESMCSTDLSDNGIDVEALVEAMLSVD